MPCSRVWPQGREYLSRLLVSQVCPPSVPKKDLCLRALLSDHNTHSAAITARIPQRTKRALRSVGKHRLLTSTHISRSAIINLPVSESIVAVGVRQGKPVAAEQPCTDVIRTWGRLTPAGSFPLVGGASELRFGYLERRQATPTELFSGREASTKLAGIRWPLQERLLSTPRGKSCPIPCVIRRLPRAHRDRKWTFGPLRFHERSGTLPPPGGLRREAW